jgi:hypothetical protein
MVFRVFLSLLVVAALAPATVVAQSLDREAQREVVSHLEVALKQNYIFPDRIPAISAELGRRIQSEPIGSEQFAESLTLGLIKASADLHFSVAFDPDEVAAGRRAKAEGDATTQAQRDSERAANFGFRDARRLDGGLAYVRFDFFADPQYAQETAAGAMRFAEGAKGLIIDLRYNNGGVLEMAQFLMSYLYPAGKDQKFFDYYYTENGVSRGAQPMESGRRSRPAFGGYSRRGADRIDVLLLRRMDGVFAATAGPCDRDRRTDRWGRASRHPRADRRPVHAADADR